jgi:hypothetical protein
MRMMVDVDFPIEPFNQMLKDGKVGPAIEQILADIKPEAIYFRERQGMRGATMFVNMTDTSQMPAIAEPFFILFHAMVNFEPVMTPEELGKANLDALGKKCAVMLRKRASAASSL